MLLNPVRRPTSSFPLLAGAGVAHAFSAKTCNRRLFKAQQQGHLSYSRSSRLMPLAYTLHVELKASGAALEHRDGSLHLPEPELQLLQPPGHVELPSMSRKGRDITL